MTKPYPRPTGPKQPKPQGITQHSGPGAAADEARNKSIARESAKKADNSGQSSHGPAKR